MKTLLIPADDQLGEERTWIAAPPRSINARTELGVMKGGLGGTTVAGRVGR